MVVRLFRDHDDVIDWATSPAGPDINRLLVKVNGLLETDRPSLPTELFQCTRKSREKKDFFFRARSWQKFEKGALSLMLWWMKSGNGPRVCSWDDSCMIHTYGLAPRCVYRVLFLVAITICLGGRGFLRLSSYGLPPWAGYTVCIMQITWSGSEIRLTTGRNTADA